MFHVEPAFNEFCNRALRRHLSGKYYRLSDSWQNAQDMCIIKKSNTSLGEEIMNVALYNNGHQWMPAIIKRGIKHMHVVQLSDHGVIVKARPIKEEKFLQPLQYKGKPYPLARAVRLFRQRGRELGITESAKNILKEARETV
jgi:hypothetical protein